MTLIATMTMENGKKIVFELLPEIAPNTVASFVHLAEMGCFDNYSIDRVEPGFVVDISTRAFGKDECKYLIHNEAINQREIKNCPVAEPGSVMMGGYDNGIAGGEFFFPLARFERLDGNYPVFGRIIEGLNEILRIGKVEVREKVLPFDSGIKLHEPLEQEIIRQVKIEKSGMVFSLPSKLDAELPPGWLVI